ncbi:MAG: glycosyltransferase family 2 protein [Tepidisphaeraceae bacterium]|jgi:glycosyltransferase involved in cell wall biosynthesis
MPAPSISIITPSFNGGAFLGHARDSILGQEGDFELEWLVIDGGSSDGSVQLLQSISDGDPRLRWSSQGDRGQANAINKGLAMAKGDIVAWLNCDDEYAPGSLAIVAKAFEEAPSAQWLVGRCDIIDRDGNLARSGVTDFKNRRLRSFSYKSLLRMNFISQPAVFWRRPFGLSVGELDELLYWTMDYDLWLRMARRCPPLVIDRTLARFRVHDSSKSRGGYRRQFAEGYRVACRYAGDDPLSRWLHRLNVERIVWGYRALRALGR